MPFFAHKNYYRTWWCLPSCTTALVPISDSLRLVWSRNFRTQIEPDREHANQLSSEPLPKSSNAYKYLLGLECLFHCRTTLPMQHQWMLLEDPIVKRNSIAHSDCQTGLCKGLCFALVILQTAAVWKAGRWIAIVGDDRLSLIIGSHLSWARLHRLAYHLPSIYIYLSLFGIAISSLWGRLN